MSQVFISYRHTSPDEELAGLLVSYLESRGVGVFVDTKIHVGAKWVEEIERQLRSSGFLVVLLSKESIRSDMVRQEVKLAREIGLPFASCRFALRLKARCLTTLAPTSTRFTMRSGDPTRTIKP